MVHLRIKWICWLFAFSLIWLGKAYAVQSSFTIEGVADSHVLANIRVFLDNIDPPTAAHQFDAYQKQLQQKAQQAVEVFGYYQANIVASLAGNKTDPQNWRIKVELGPETRVTKLQITLEGAAKDDPELQKVLNSLPLHVGAQLNHADYENSKTQLQSLALYRGYFDFEFDTHQIKVDKSENSASILLHASSGERYRFDELKLAEDERATELIYKLLTFNPGDYYLADKISKFNRLLKDTQYFQSVLVRPLVFEAQQHSVPVEVLLTHKPRDNFDFGGGFSSDIGPRIKLKWRRPWVNSHGHSMGGELFLSDPEKHLALDYRIPLEDPVQNFASFQLGYQSINDNDTVSDKFTLGVQRHRSFSGSDWQRISFVRLEQESFRQGNEPKQTTTLLIPGVTFSRLRTKGGMDVFWGDKQIITTEFAAEDAGSDLNMLRISAKSQWLRSIGLHRFLMRGEIGAIATNSFSEVPSSLRYFAGGDQSIRGFGYRTLSPFDDQGELTGGQYLAVGSIEYSYPLTGGWRAATFIDAGNAANDFNRDLATGVGIGVNWLSPVGPIKLYVARGHSSFDNTWRLHFSMGPTL